MKIDWDVWAVDDVGADRIECRKVVDIESGRAIAFVIRGGRIEPGSDPDGPTHEAAFDSFTMDGREPTEAEQDEHTDALRAVVWDCYTDTAFDDDAPFDQP